MVRRGVIAAWFGLAGCGPEAPASVAAGTTTASTTTPTTSSSDGSSDSSDSTAAGTSSSGEPPEVVVVEGVWRWTGGLKGWIEFQACDGEWILLGAPSEGEIVRAGSGCSGRYLRLRGTRGLVPGHLGQYEGVIIDDVLEARFCEPGDCGETTCEPIVCIYECDQQSQQDCADGEKCVFYPVDGGTNGGTRCVPIDVAPVGLGESCTRDAVEFGVDNCEAGAVCLGGFEDREGVCVEMCEGPLTMPGCSQGECAFGAGAAAYCLPTCGAVEDECDGLCLPMGELGSDVCVPEVGIPELFAPCERGECTGTNVCSGRGPTRGLCVPA